jgi:hypothetical protein
VVRVRFWEWDEKRVDSDREFAWPAPDGAFRARPPVNALVEPMSTSLAHNAVLRVGSVTPLRCVCSVGPSRYDLRSAASIFGWSGGNQVTLPGNVNVILSGHA